MKSRVEGPVLPSLALRWIAKLKSGMAQNNQPIQVSTKQDVDEFHFDPIDELFVSNQLSKLKANKATGLDRITARLLKNAAVQITPVLINLFNRSLLSSTFPSAWKSGKVVPLYKSGDGCNPSNYRPITVLPKSWRKPFIPKFIATSFNIKFYPNVNLVSDLNYQLRLPLQILRTSYLVTWIKVVSKGQFLWICEKLLTP